MARGEGGGSWESVNRQLGETLGILIAGKLSVENVLEGNLRRILPFFSESFPVRKEVSPLDFYNPKILTVRSFIA